MVDRVFKYDPNASLNINISNPNVKITPRNDLNINVDHWELATVVEQNKITLELGKLGYIFDHDEG